MWRPSPRLGNNPRVRSALLAGVAACVLLAVSLVPAAAAPSGADPTPTPKAGIAGRVAKQILNDTQRLERLLQRERKELEAAQSSLAKADDLAQRVRARIETMKSRGQDTSVLEAALADFQKSVDSARGSYNAAKSALDGHAGFDDAGKVTDPTAAAATLDSAQASLQQFHQTMVQARRAFRQGLGEQSLERRLIRERDRLTVEQRRLDRAGKLAEEAQGVIDKQKAAGKDTSKLETALADFKAAIATAQGSYDAAKSALASPEGFDTNGNVTDPAKARETLTSVAKDFQQVNQTLRDAERDLKQAMKEFRASLASAKS